MTKIILKVIDDEQEEIIIGNEKGVGGIVSKKGTDRDRAILMELFRTILRELYDDKFRLYILESEVEERIRNEMRGLPRE